MSFPWAPLTTARKRFPAFYSLFISPRGGSRKIVDQANYPSASFFFLVAHAIFFFMEQGASLHDSVVWPLLIPTHFPVKISPRESLVGKRRRRVEVVTPSLRQTMREIGRGERERERAIGIFLRHKEEANQICVSPHHIPTNIGCH